MNDQIAVAARSILDDSLKYLIAAVLASIFVVFRMFLRGGGDYKVGERFMASLPLQFLTLIAVAIVFVANHLGDILLVGHTHPWWGLYVSTLAMIGSVGVAYIAWNYFRESRRPYSIADTSDGTETAGDQYRQRVVIELKGAVVWLLLSGLAGAWLDKIGRG